MEKGAAFGNELEKRQRLYFGSLRIELIESNDVQG